jgi:hypothetical protein
MYPFHSRHFPQTIPICLKQSGAPLRLSHYPGGQPYVDQLAKLLDCDSFKVKSALACLRAVPAERLYDAIQKTPDLMEYSSIKLAWQPRKEVKGTPGALWTEEPWRAVEEGRIAKVLVLTLSHIYDLISVCRSQ